MSTYHTHTIITAVVLLAMVSTPFVSEAQTDELSCPEISDQYESFREGGQQVPVFDESNLLVNSVAVSALESLWVKECIIDVKVRAQALQILEKMTEATIEYVKEGRTFRTAQDILEGGAGSQEPFYVNEATHVAKVVKRARELWFAEERNAIPEDHPFRSKVLEGMKADLENNAEYTLDQVDDPDALINEGEINSLEEWSALREPRNNPWSDWIYSQRKLSEMERAARAIERGKIVDGYIAQTDEEGNIVKPASVISQKLDSALNQDFRRVENTDEAGELITQTVGAVTAQVTDKDKGIPDIRARSEEGWPVTDYYHDVPFPDELDFSVSSGFGDFSFDDWGVGDLIDTLPFSEVFDQFNFDELFSELGLDVFDDFGIERLLDEYGLDEILDNVGIGDILDQVSDFEELTELLDDFELEQLLKEGHLEDLLSSIDGFDELLRSLEQSEVYTLLNELNIDPNDYDSPEKLFDAIESATDGPGGQFSDLSSEAVDALDEAILTN